MEREILFRGKRDGDDWIFGDLWQQGDVICIKPISSTDICLRQEVNPKTVGQLSPFTAKGKSLFVGDQISSTLSSGEVVTHTLISVFQIRHEKLGWISILRQGWIDECGYELSGNIHEKSPSK